MTKQIRFNAFEMNCIAHQSPGFMASSFRSLKQNIKILNIGLTSLKSWKTGYLMAFLLRMYLGYMMFYHQSAEHALTGAVQVPVNDPLQIIPAMAAVTRHLGFWCDNINIF